MNNNCSSVVKFGLNLFNQMSTAYPNCNVFMSPMSVILSLNMIMLGTQGETQEQIIKVLKFPIVNVSEVHGMFLKFSRRVLNNENNPNERMRIVNRFFVDYNQSYYDDYIQGLKNYYNTELQTLDFQHSLPGAISTMNEWVKNVTNNEIKNLIIFPDTLEEPKFILVNIPYFKPTWKNMFVKDLTMSLKFYVSRKIFFRVPFMQVRLRSLKYYYHRELKSQILELPFAKTANLIVILPDRFKTSLAEVERKMTECMLADITRNFFVENVNVSLPKFKIHMEPDLLKILRFLGVSNLFTTPAVANVSEIETGDDIHLTNIIHRTFINIDDVDEGLKIKRRSKKTLKSVKFMANHPFMFLIRDWETALNLFIGKVLNPRTTSGKVNEEVINNHRMYLGKG